MKKIIENAIYVLLFLSAIVSLFVIIRSSYTADIRFYIGFASIVLCYLLRLKNVIVSNYILTTVLLLGTINLLQFSYVDFSLSFTFLNITTLGINPIVLITLISLLIVNKDIIMLFTGESNSDSNEVQKQNEEMQIQGYMLDYKDKSIEELQYIINNPDNYVKPLVVAVQRIIKDKK